MSTTDQALTIYKMAYEGAMDAYVKGMAAGVQLTMEAMAESEPDSIDGDPVEWLIHEVKRLALTPQGKEDAHRAVEDALADAARNHLKGDE